MHRISLIGPIALFLALVSCEKDIDIDYRQVAPLYVVEANVNQDRSTVRITMTQNMDDNSNNHGVEGATVVISSGDSISRRLNYSRDGYYSAALPGKPGTRYNLTIDVTKLFADDDPNATLLELVSLVEQYGDTYTDDLPITREPPFEYIENMTDIQRTMLNAYFVRHRSGLPSDSPSVLKRCSERE